MSKTIRNISITLALIIASVFFLLNYRKTGSFVANVLGFMVVGFMMIMVIYTIYHIIVRLIDNEEVVVPYSQDRDTRFVRSTNRVIDFSRFTLEIDDFFMRDKMQDITKKISEIRSLKGYNDHSCIEDLPADAKDFECVYLPQLKSFIKGYLDIQKFAKKEQTQQYVTRLEKVDTALEKLKVYVVENKTLLVDTDLSVFEGIIGVDSL